MEEQAMRDRSALVNESRRELARFPALLGSLVAGLDAESWRARPVPDEWAPVEIVCHLRDEEAEDFGARVRVILAGQDRFEPIDPERWAVERHYREADPATALAAFRRLRAENLALLADARIDDLARAGAQPGGSVLSGLDLVVAWVTHDRLHLHQLVGTLARLWADRWAPHRAAYAGPIPYTPSPSSTVHPSQTGGYDG
jgi:DinB superfamily